MAERKKTADMQKLARELLTAPLGEEDAIRQELEARGVTPNGAGALLYAQWKEAVRGDLKAASFLKDLAGVGEAPKKPGKKAAPDLKALSDEQLLAMLAEGGRSRAER